MKDAEIVDLYWERNEAAIQQTQQKYGAYLLKIAVCLFQLVFISFSVSKANVFFGHIPK